MVNHTTQPSPKRHLASLCLVIGLLAPACAKHPASQGEEVRQDPIEECDAYLASLRHCLEKLGPADIAAARVAQARASLDAELARSSRDSARKQCITSLANMTCR